MSEEELGPLPAGRHGLSREQVALNQRERLVGGLVEAITEHGYNAVTITDVTKAARVSRRAFYENFKSKEECFIAAFEIVVEHVRALVADAVAPVEDWPHEVIAAFRTLLDYFSAEPDLARLCFVETQTAGPDVAERFREEIYGLIPLLERGRAERSSDRALPASTESSVIGALGDSGQPLDRRRRSRAALTAAPRFHRVLPDAVPGARGGAPPCLRGELSSLRRKHPDLGFQEPSPSIRNTCL